MCRKLCNSWHSFLRLSYVSFVWEIRKFNLIIFQLLKIKAIQISLFVDFLNAFLAMIDSLSAVIHFRIIWLLLLHWQSFIIIKKVHCCFRMMYSILKNIFMYSSLFKSQFRFKEILCKMFKTAENDLIVYLENQSCRKRWSDTYERSETLMYIDSWYQEFWREDAEVIRKNNV